jgi:hypothetical protein
MSRRAYAAARGVDEAAIRKAIRSGRIVPNAAGLIDPDQADANWWRYSQRNPQTYATADSSIAWRRPGAAWLAGVNPRGAIAPAQSACQNAEPVLYSRRRGFGAALERDRSGAAGRPRGRGVTTIIPASATPNLLPTGSTLR